MNMKQKMQKGAFDLCLTILPIDEKLYSYETVMEEELVLAVPADYPELKGSVEPNRKYPANKMKIAAPIRSLYYRK